MSLLSTVVAFIVALGVLIVVHELGHYTVARLCGVRVLRFSVGFGRTIWSRRFKVDGTEWAIAALPLGGYVKMVDEREGEVASEDLPYAFNRKGVGRRFAIVAAGPLANFILAILLYWALFMSGVPDAKPMIASPEIGTPAAAAGLVRGDTILSIAGERVEGWQEARWHLMQAALGHAQLQLEVIDRAGHLSWKQLDLRGFDQEQLEGDPIARIGFRLYRPDAVIGRTITGGVAERAGLALGDRIVEAAGRPVRTWDEFVVVVRNHASQRLDLRLVRDGDERMVSLTPDTVDERGRSIGRIGAEPRLDAEEAKNLFTVVRHGPVEAMRLSLAKTWETVSFSLRMIGRMIVGEISWRNLSGPVTIADYAGQSAQAGWTAYLIFIALISISLGVLNLLPIPLLDGGHLLYYTVEFFKGSPVSDKAMELGQRLGLGVLLFLMAFAFYNDINRLLSG